MFPFANRNLQTSQSILFILRVLNINVWTLKDDRIIPIGDTFTKSLRCFIRSVMNIMVSLYVENINQSLVVPFPDSRIHNILQASVLSGIISRPI